MKNVPVLYTIIIILAILLILSLLGICQQNNSAVVPSTGILSSIEKNNSHGAILISNSGKLSLVNSKGEPSKPCTFASSDALKTKGKGKPCKGYVNGKVLGMAAIPLLYTKGSFCMGIIDSSGQPFQVCD